MSRAVVPLLVVLVLLGVANLVAWGMARHKVKAALGKLGIDDGPSDAPSGVFGRFAK